MTRHTLTMAALLILSACDADVCPEGQVRDGDDCVAYQPDDPEPAGEVWAPAPGTTWQWQITGTVDTSLDVVMYDVDLFDLTDKVAAELEADGKTLICYFSAGSYEPWRPDAADFPEAAIGKTLEGWADERWLDVTDATVRDVMRARLELAAEKGCDGVEPDNVTAHHNNTGFGINATEQLEYNRFLADESHKLGLSVGLKNDMDQAAALLDWFDWALNEECYDYDECDTLAPFVDAGKAVFHVEYVDEWADAPAKAAEVCGIPGFSTLVKGWDLGAEFQDCD